MSHQLKLNSKNFSTQLELDKNVLLEANAKLERNEVGLKVQGKRLEEKRKAGRFGTMWIIGAVGAVGVAWVMMFLLIKVS